MLELHTRFRQNNCPRAKLLFHTAAVSLMIQTVKVCSSQCKTVQENFLSSILYRLGDDDASGRRHCRSTWLSDPVLHIHSGLADLKTFT